MRLNEIIPPVFTKYINRFKSSRPQYFGFNKLDQKLEKYLNFRNGYFVELGANDGVTQSNTLYYERYKDWRGILVEPAPHNFLKCRENRSSSSFVFCNACTSFDYKEKFVEISYSNLMSTAIGLESDIDNPKGHAEKGKIHLQGPEENFTFGAVARPLNDLLIEAHAPAMMDFLSLDVEGAEIEVLKGIDHERFRFRFLCIESRSNEYLQYYLKSRGYKFLEMLSTHDYIYCIE